MYHSFNFPDVLATSARAAWQIEDILPPGSRLDMSRNFMPEGLARTAAASTLTAGEQRTLNQIRGHEYLAVFGIVEEFVLPFVLDHARPLLNGDDHRVRALLQFAGEEAKHIHLFRQFHHLFTETFETRCDMIGPAAAIGAEILRHDPLAVALLILQVEWMTQGHYLDSVRDDRDLDPLFRSLLKHHWIEEAQHAKLDTLMVEALAEGRAEASIQAMIDEYLEMIAFLDAGLSMQAGFNIDALERASNRPLPAAERTDLIAAQHQAIRWTYIGSGLVHPRFVATLTAVSPVAAARVAAITPTYC